MAGRMTDEEILQLILKVWPGLSAAYDQYEAKWRLNDPDGEGPGLYTVTGQLLLPLVVRPLLSMSEPDDEALKAVCDLAEALLASGDGVAMTLARIELCPEFMAAACQDRLDAHLGVLTRAACAVK